MNALYLLTCPRHCEFFTGEESTARKCDAALRAEGVDFSLWKQGGAFRGVARVPESDWMSFACEVGLRGASVIRTPFTGEGLALVEANLIRQGKRLLASVPSQEEGFLALMNFEFGPIGDAPQKLRLVA